MSYGSPMWYLGQFGGEVHSQHDGKQTGMALELRTSHSVHRKQVEKDTGTGEDFYNLKSHP